MSTTNFSMQNYSRISMINGKNIFSEVRSVNNFEIKQSPVSLLEHTTRSVPDKQPILDQQFHQSSSEDKLSSEDVDEDVDMESDNSLTSKSPSLEDENISYKKNLSKSKFTLKPLKPISSMTSISNLSPATSNFSMASPDNYFAYPQPLLTNSVENDKIIPTKPCYKTVKSVLPPNPAILISSKPTLSWIPISNSNDTNSSIKGSSIYQTGPSKTSFIVSPTIDTDIQVNTNSQTNTPKDSRPTNMVKIRGMSYVEPLLKESSPLKLNNSNSFVTTPRLPRHCKVRRTHSMYQHPKDVLADNIMDSIAIDENTGSSPRTPITECNSVFSMKDCPIKTFNVKEDQFKRMNPETLCKIMDGIYSDLYERYLIIDCRFEYEFNGGHIEGAININSIEKLEEILFSNVPVNERVLLIFHCEYSSHRGPRMAMHLRNMDRQRNINRYPYLHYPDIAILAGGYSLFFSQFNMRCYPQKYVEMNDTSHKVACEREMGRFRRSMKLSRTQSEFLSSKLSKLRPTFLDHNENDMESKDINLDVALDESPLMNASKSYSCFELSNPIIQGVGTDKESICKGKRDSSFTNVKFNFDDPQTTPTICNSQFRRKLGVKLNFSKF